MLSLGTSNTRDREDKDAIIYGDGGKVGGAVARVFLIGRTLERLEEVVEENAALYSQVLIAG